MHCARVAIMPCIGSEFNGKRIVPDGVHHYDYCSRFLFVAPSRFYAH